MELLQQKRALDILFTIFNLKPGKTQYVKPGPQKIPFPADIKYTSPLPRMTPEEAGVPSEWLYNLYSTLEKDSEGVLHTVMFLRHGAVIAEASFHPYSANVWHASHSMCKSITALAVGILAESGKIDISAPVYEYITEARTLLPFSKYKSITVDNLLSMSSGVSFAEAGSVTDEDWLRGFFESAVKMEPGTAFSYNSMNTYVLGAIVTRITGMTLSDYVQQNIFAPMGITTFHWEKSPTGLTKAGWGLYMLPEDMAKIGLLFLNRGVWEGKTLVPASWIDYISKKTFDTPVSMSRYGYGRHVWIGPRPGSFVCNGLFGQNIIILPDLDSVLVTTAAVDSFFQTCRMTDIINDMLVRAEFSDKQLPPDNDAYTKLNNYLKSLGEYPINKKNEPQTHHQTTKNGIFSRITSSFKNKTAHLSQKTAHTSPNVPLFCRQLNGVSYDFRGDNVGIIPLSCQMIQNNYDNGIQGVRFEYDETSDEFTVIFEHNGEPIPIPVGFGRAEFFEYDLNGEIYLLACEGELRENEDGEPVLKLRIPCLEMPCERRIKIYFTQKGESIRINWAEVPGRKLLMQGIDYMMKTNLNRPIINTLASKIDKDYFEYRLDRIINPTFTGTRR